MNLSASVDEIREFVYRSVKELRELLHHDPRRSKAALSQHIGRLVLTPTETPSGPMYEVSDGGMNLLPGKDVMPFGGLDSATCVSVALILGVVALFASYMPARKALRVDPAHVLRCE